MSFALAIASASSLNGIRQATGPKISSCAMRMRLLDVGEHRGLDEIALLERTARARGASGPPHISVAPSLEPKSM